MVGDPETLVVDSTLLLVLHARQVGQSAGFPGAARVGWDSFPVYEVKLHLCSAPPNRMPVSYEPSGQRCRNQAHRGVALRSESRPGRGAPPLRDLAYRNEMLEEDLVGRGIRLVTDSAEQGGKRQQVKIAFASLKREFRLGGRSPPRSPALRPGSRPSSPPTPAPSCSTATSAVLRDGLKSCGPENRETLI